MSQQGCIAKPGTLQFLVVAACFCLSPFSASAQVDCITNALSGYRGGECIVHIDRKNLSSRPGIVVPRGTKVTIELDDTRWDETVQFNPATTQNPDQDVLSTVLKNIFPALGVLSISQTPGHGFTGDKNDSDVAKQAEITKTLTDAALSINNTFTELTCFETYKKLLPIKEGKAYACSLDPLNGPLPLIKDSEDETKQVAQKDDTYRAAKKALIEHLRISAAIPLPLESFAEVDEDIKNKITACKAPTPARTDAERTACYAANDSFQTNQDRFKGIIGSLEKIQLALQADAMTLKAWPGTDPVQKWSIVQTRNRTSTVTIVATEIIVGTPVTLGTVSVTWQTQPFVLSTGILLSTLRNRSYAISQIIVNGVPQPDPAAPTKYLTQVTESDVSPSIVFPMVYGSYRIGPLSRLAWENRCPNHCAFLLSAGMGANLTGKTAEFGLGPSFQIGSVLFTAAAHIGRESLLTNGFYVGEHLGSSPPSALTTKNSWTTRFGFSISYVIPTP